MSDIFEILQHDDFERFMTYMVKIDNVDMIVEYPFPRKDSEIPERITITMLRDSLPIISLAAYYGAVQCFEYLLNNGANVHITDNMGRSVSHFASSGGNNTIVDTLDNAGLDFTASDNNGLSCVHYCCLSGRIDLLQRFDERGISLTTPSNIGWLPIHCAAMAPTADCLAYLHGKGTELNVTCEGGKTTPLKLAVIYGYPVIIQYLIEHNVDINIIVSESRNSLQHAAYIGNLQMCKLFLERDMTLLNVGDTLGWTPLIWAASNGHLEVVKYLVEKGADVNQCTNHNFSPVKAAENRRHNEIADFLKSKGGVPYPAVR